MAIEKIISICFNFHGTVVAIKYLQGSHTFQFHKPPFGHQNPGSSIASQTTKCSHPHRSTIIAMRFHCCNHCTSRFLPYTVLQMTQILVIQKNTRLMTEVNRFCSQEAKICHQESFQGFISKVAERELEFPKPLVRLVLHKFMAHPVPSLNVTVRAGLQTHLDRFLVCNNSPRRPHSATESHPLSSFHWPLCELGSNTLELGCSLGREKHSLFLTCLANFVDLEVWWGPSPRHQSRQGYHSSKQVPPCL